MKPVKFIHCADLHLGAPFKGVSSINPDLGEILHASTYKSFENIVKLAVEEYVDFVLIAGDVYDSEDKSLRAQLKFMNGLSQLSKAGIQTFITHGNHDPLSGWSAALKWPDGVYIFPGDKVEGVPFRSDGKILVWIYGISFLRPDIKENLALKYYPEKDSIPKIGLLHTNVGGNQDHEPYAPCKLEDLVGMGIDYWALGHVHEKTILRPMGPAIIYSGCSQSRSPREVGPKGCYVVTLDTAKTFEAHFVPTDSVRYQSDFIDIASCISMDEIVSSIVNKCRDNSVKSDNRNLIVRLMLKGKTILNSDLRREGSISDLLGHARELLTGQEPVIWIDKIELDTTGVFDLDSLRHGNDFVADIISVFDELEDPKSTSWQELEKKFQPLFANWAGHSYLEKPAPNELMAIAREAREQTLDAILKEEV